MTDFWAIRKGDGLFPDSVESASVFAKLPFSKPIHVTVRRPRNAAHHRLFFALVHRIAEGVGSDPENVRQLLQISSGHYTLVKTKSHGELKLPKSIAFSSMDQQAFSELFERMVQIIYAEWGIDPSAVEDLLVPQTTHLKDDRAA